MKNRISYFLAAAVAVLAVSCAKDVAPEINEPNFSVRHIKAYTDSDFTKTALAEDLTQVNWSAGDAITVFDDQENPYHSNSLTEGGVTADFTVSMPEESSIDAAVYPKDENATYDVRGDIYSTFPASQTAKVNSFGDGANLAVADGANSVNELSFKNVGGLLALTVKSDCASDITSIAISANEYMAGPVKIDKTIYSSTIDDKREGASKSISLTGPFVNNGTYYFVVLPGTYTGLTIIFTKNNGATATYTNAKTLEVTRNSNTAIGTITIADSKWVAPKGPVYTLAFEKLTQDGDHPYVNSYVNSHPYIYENVSWTIWGNQTAGTNLRIGGKNTTATDKTITSTDKITGAINRIVVNHSGYTNGSNSAITVNSFSAEVSNSEDFATLAQKVTLTPTIENKTAGKFEFELDDAYEDCYYRITLNYQISGSNNCYVTLNTIEFFGIEYAPRYNVTISDGIVGGSVTASAAKAEAGTTVTLNPVANAGYEFSSWNVTCDGNSVTVTDNKFEMPEGDVIVSGTFSKTDLAITKTAATNGSFKVTMNSSEVSTAQVGDEVTLVANPDPNYELKSWTVYKTGDESTKVTVTNNAFTMPAYPVTVAVEFKDASSGPSYGDPVTAEIKFSTTDVKIDAASKTGDDDKSNTWTITTVGTTSFTPQPTYCQIGASKSPATSITFTTTLPKNAKVTAMSAKFGGFSGTAGTVTLKVGSETLGTGSLNAANDVTVSVSNKNEVGKVLTVTVTGIAKGVKVYNISATYQLEN